MEWDRIIHEPARLKIVVLLSGVEQADFNFLREALDLTNGNLGAHMDRLEKAGYVEVIKSFQGRKPHTDYRLTATGHGALNEYWTALDRIRGEAADRSFA